MTTFQTLQEGLSDPRHLGTTLFAPRQWLHKEIQPIFAPFKGDDLGTELVRKIGRVALIVMMPFAYLFTAVGYAYNLAAHFLNPLEKQPPKIDPPSPSSSVVQVSEEDSSPQENIYENLFSEVNMLRSDFEAIFEEEGFPGLRGQKRDELIRRFKEVRKQVLAFQESQTTLVRSFYEIEEQFTVAFKNWRNLVYSPIRMTDEGRIPISDRGNCFYEAVSRAYELYNCGSNPELLDHKLLRQQIIQWERENIDLDPFLMGLVDTAIDFYITDKQREIQGKKADINLLTKENPNSDVREISHEIQKLEDELEPFQIPAQRIAYYFEKATEVGFWAGLPEFYTFAHKYNVFILVREKNRGIEKPENECFRFNVGAPKQMILWWIDGHHFEVKID